jgi:hypothetical protein
MNSLSDIILSSIALILILSIPITISIILQKFNMFIFTFIGVLIIIKFIIIVYSGGIYMIINYLNDLNLRNTIVPIVALIGTFSIGFSNIIRYLISKEYRIPFKLTYQNINENIETFAFITMFLGIGVLLPLLVSLREEIINALNTNIAVLSPVIVTILAVLLVNVPREQITFFRVKDNFIRTKELENKKIRKTAKIFKVVLVINCFFAVSSFGYFSLIEEFGNIFDIIPTIFIIIHTIIICIITLLYVTSKVFQNKNFLDLRRVQSVVNIENNNYLISMKHSSEEWILIPYTLKDDEIYFYYQEFLIKKISEFQIKTIDAKFLRAAIR